MHDIVSALALAASKFHAVVALRSCRFTKFWSAIAVACPEAISYASLAGMPLANGLYTAYTAPLAYSLFGASPQIVTGPTTVLSVITLNAMQGIRTWGGVTLVAGSALYVQVAGLLALMVGLQVLGLAAIGGAALASLVSVPIVVGFTSGSAVVIGLSQVRVSLAVHLSIAAAILPSKSSSSRSFLALQSAWPLTTRVRAVTCKTRSQT